ncbi:MAG: isoprenyl transferase [Bacteroidales bacterium]
MTNLKNKIEVDKLPKHVAIIMDGNGRWAKHRSKERNDGHEEGMNSLEDILEASAEIGLKYLTVYAFSTENWKRPKEEVDLLMSLMARAIELKTDKLDRLNMQLKVIGNKQLLPEEVRKSIEKTEEKLSDNTGTIFVVALSYSSRLEIIDAVKLIAEDVCNNNISKDDITPELFESYLMTTGIPDPELLIRTSGEQRISNFLLWQISYSELYFPKVMWPDFKKNNFYEAIYKYQQRERRFGMTGDQIKKENDNLQAQ